MAELFKFLENPSVAAFIGAASAFFLVAANDYRRRLAKKRALKFIVQDQADMARDKLESIRNMIQKMQENIFCAAPIMPFDVSQVRLLQHDVIDLLDANQNQGLNAILYWMQAIDELLGKVLRKSEILEELSRRDAPNEERQLIGEWILSELRDADRNMQILLKMFNNYVSGKPHLILEEQHEIPIPKTRSS